MGLGMFATWSFRFRGKVGRLLAIVNCFREEPMKGLHPRQIAKRTGIDTFDVIRHLTTTPELFVKLPGRLDGITRYRLVSSLSGQGIEEIEALITRNARRETAIYYAFIAMLMLALAVMVMVIVPTLPGAGAGGEAAP